MRFTSVRVMFALLFLSAAGCDTSYAPITDPPPPIPPPAPINVAPGLWTVSGAPGEILRLDPSQLLTTGARKPATRLFTSSASLFALNSVAFDSTGALWVASRDDSLLLAFDPGSADDAGFTTPSIIISPIGRSLSSPAGMAFDKQFNLWVANFAAGTIVRYDKTQLRASGSPVPAVTISGVAHPTGLAFDASGTLWVTDILANTVSRYLVGQLLTSGAKEPAIILSTAGKSLVNPSGIAFDAANNMWIANVGNGSVTAFRPPQRSGSGSPEPFLTLQPNDGSLDIASGLAFDDEGSLWVMSGTGTLAKFTLQSIAASGPATPDVRIEVQDHVLFWNIAFWPKTSGLPLN